MSGPFLRHVVILAGVAALAYWLRGTMPVEGQPIVWLGAAAIVGVAAAFVAGAWTGLLFVLLGAAVGVMLELQLRSGSGAAGLDELQSSGPILLAAGAAMVVAYVAVLAALRVVRRSA